MECIVLLGFSFYFNFCDFPSGVINLFRYSVSFIPKFSLIRFPQRLVRLSRVGNSFQLLRFLAYLAILSCVVN